MFFIYFYFQGGYGGSYGNSGTYIGQFYKGNDNGYHLKLKMYDKPVAALLRSTQTSPHLTGNLSHILPCH